MLMVYMCKTCNLDTKRRAHTLVSRLHLFTQISFYQVKKITFLAKWCGGVQIYHLGKSYMPHKCIVQGIGMM